MTIASPAAPRPAGLDGRPFDVLELRPQTSSSPPDLSYFEWSMARHLRQCVECPKCGTRYLIGFSPCDNGSYLLSPLESHLTEYRLYCSCGRMPITCRGEGLRRYAVSRPAYERGYGSAEEITPLAR